jgi:hypothetical protein
LPGDLAEGERVVEPLRSFGAPLADLVAPMPYTALQTASDASYPDGQRNYWKSHYVDEITDETIARLMEHAPQMPSPLSSFYLQHLGGAIGRPGPDAAAFGQRDAMFDFTILTVWQDPAMLARSPNPTTHPHLEVRSDGRIGSRAQAAGAGRERIRAGQRAPGIGISARISREAGRRGREGRGTAAASTCSDRRKGNEHQSGRRTRHGTPTQRRQSESTRAARADTVQEADVVHEAPATSIGATCTVR